jgi:hypothetical protein
MRTLIDIAINIIVPLICLLVSGSYVYKSGRFIAGILMTWGLLFGYEVLSLIMGFIVFKFYPSYSTSFEGGPGIAVMLMVGWLPGIIVSLIAVIIRKIVYLNSQANHSTRSAKKE